MLLASSSSLCASRYRMLFMSVAGDILDPDDEMLTSSFGGSVEWSYGQVRWSEMTPENTAHSLENARYLTTEQQMNFVSASGP